MVILGLENVNFQLTQHEIDFKNIDIDKMIRSNKDCYDKKILNILLDTKMMKKLSYYV